MIDPKQEIADTRTFAVNHRAVVVVLVVAALLVGALMLAL